MIISKLFRGNLYFLFNYFLIFIFTFNSLVFSFSSQMQPVAISSVSSFSPVNFLDQISFSSQYGIIDEIHDETNQSNKTIIHIKDAHCNYEAQKNIYQILKVLTEDHNVSLIAQEGAQNYLDTNQFKYPSVSDGKIREITDAYLKDGSLTASEALAIDNIKDLKFDIFGVENRDLYLQNYRAFLSTYGEKQNSSVFFKEIKSIFSKLKKRKLSNELQQFLVLNEEIDSLEKINLKKKILLLNKYIIKLKKSNFNVSNFINFINFSKILKYEKTINFELVEAEENSFYLQAKSLLDEKAYSFLLSLFLERQTKKISEYQFYNGIIACLKKISLDKTDYKKFKNFFEYAFIQKSYKEIYVNDLISEIKELELKIKLAMSTSSDEKHLVLNDYEIKIIEKILNLQATNKEVNYYFKTKNYLHIDEKIDWLVKEASIFKISFPYALKKDLFPIKLALKNAAEFYHFALKRDKVLIENLLKEMEKKGENVAVLITGGFHTKGITDIIRDKKISYAVIAPAIRNDFSSDLYYKIMLNQKKRNNSQLYSIPDHLASVMLLDKEILVEEFNESEKGTLVALRTVLGVVADEFDEDNVRTLMLSHLKKPSLIRGYEAQLEKIIDNNPNHPATKVLKTLQTRLKEQRYSSMHDNRKNRVYGKFDIRASNVTEDLEKIFSSQVLSESRSISADSTIQNQVHHLNHTVKVSKEKREWNAKDIDNLFEKFFSDQTSPYTTSASRNDYINEILEILLVEPDGPPPPDDEDFTFSSLNIGEKILNNYDNIVPLYDDYIAKFPRKISRIEVFTNFYLDFDNISEEDLLIKFRALLAYVRKLQYDRAVQKADVSTSIGLQDLFKYLTFKVIDKEKDALRDLKWDARDTYLKNLDYIQERIKFLPAKEDDNGRELLTVMCKVKDGEITLYYNPDLVNQLPMLKKINYFGAFYDHDHEGDRHYLEVNLLTSFVMGAILHEIRGHLKHNESEEYFPVLEQGLRYGFINYAAMCVTLALTTFRISDPSEISAVKSKIIDFTKQYIQIAIKEDSLNNVYKEYKDHFVLLVDLFLDSIINSDSETSLNKNAEEGQVEGRNEEQVFEQLNFQPFMLKNRKYYPNHALADFSKGDTNLLVNQIIDFKSTLKINMVINLRVLEKELSANQNVLNYLNENSTMTLNYLAYAGATLQDINDRISSGLLDSSSLTDLSVDELYMLIGYLNGDDVSSLLINNVSDQFGFEGLSDIEIDSLIEMFAEKLVEEFNLQINKDKQFSSNLKLSDVNVFIGDAFKKNKMVGFDALNILNSGKQDFVKLMAIHSFLAGRGINLDSFVGVRLFDLLNEKVTAKDSALKISEKQLKDVIVNIGATEGQSEDIIGFFDELFKDNGFNSDRNFDQVVSLFFDKIMAHNELAQGGITDNQKNMLAGALVDLLANYYSLSDNGYDKLVRLSKSSYKSLDADSLEKYSLLANSLLLQVKLLKKMVDVEYPEKSTMLFELDDEGLSFEFEDKVIKIHKDDLDLESIQNWNNLQFKISSSPKFAASFVELISEVLVDQKGTVLMRTINDVIETTPLMRSVNVVIEEMDNENISDANAFLINSFIKSNNKEQLFLIGKTEVILPFLEKYNLPLDLNIAEEPGNKNGGIVLGSGFYYNQVKRDMKKSGRSGLFFLNNLKSPSGAVLMGLAFAFSAYSIVDNLRKTANSKDKPKITELWEKIENYSEDSILLDEEMPAVIPLLKNLLKYLSHEEMTVLVAA